MRHLTIASLVLLSFSALCAAGDFERSLADGAARIRRRSARASFKKVVVVVLENAGYDEAIAQPFLSKLASQGALLTDFHAVDHPSQPNYIAMIAGDTLGVDGDGVVNLDARHLGDLLEAAGKTWKVYAQGYPGGCFLGAGRGAYARKHVPFLSFKNVSRDPKRCANVGDDSGFLAAAKSGGLPDFSFFVPDLDNDGHETGAAYADRWLASYFGPLLRDSAFTRDTLLAVTFDEDDMTGDNRIYTALYGASVAPSSGSNAPLTHYSLLRTIEDALGLATLGKNDASAAPISGVWR